MNVQCLIFWVVINAHYNIVFGNVNQLDKLKSRNEKSENVNYPTENTPTEPEVGYDTCQLEDFACLAMAQSDRLGLESIKLLHRQLDDDKDGNIDLSESDDFLKGELKYNSGYEKRQKNFHRNDDMHISVKELWEAWLKSEVHNWTVDQTIDWLGNYVELPQYVENFLQHKVTGANLPRLAVNNANYLAVLGIKDPIHKQKISLKAMDVVLFGPPKDSAHWKDLTLIVLSIIGSTGVWYAYKQNKKFKDHLNRMSKDMDSLQNAEKALENLQKELEVAKQAQESVISEKENLEKKLQDSKSEINTLPSSYSDLEVSQLKAEIEMLRTELQLAEGELKDKCWAPPVALQQWLQLTHEIENRAFIRKKISAEKQLQQAREACEKLRKKRSSLVGAFVSTHGKSIDEVDRSIVEARTSLTEVTQELQERVSRWKQIEMLCGFNIINNNGYTYLENTLYRNANGRNSGLRGRMNSTDDLDDDTGSIYGSYPGNLDSGQTTHHWKDVDSSSSETSKQDEEGISKVTEEKSLNSNSVHFSVGSDISPWTEDFDNKDHTVKSSPVRLTSSSKSISQSNISVIPPVRSSSMFRSSSQDVSVIGSAARTKSSSSDNILETQTIGSSSKLSKKEIQTCLPEDDVCSTDSSVLDEVDMKKKKRKLFTFTKKSKNKGD